MIGNLYSKEALVEAMKRISGMFSEYYKYTTMFVFGFSDKVPEDKIWLVDKICTQDEKRVFLMKPDGIVHKKILEIENEHNIKFDRPSEITKRILISLGFTPTDESNKSIK